MRHTREILRHKWLLGHGHRLVHATLGVSHGAITATTQRALRAGLDWDSVCVLSDADLELRLYPPPLPAGTPRPQPDWAHVDLELRKKGVTLELLSQEHLDQHPDGLRRSAFCDHYRAWKKARGLVMRQHHLGGEKLFVDYAGPKLYYTDPATGERIACELFVATLGASSYTYAEASASQQTPDFLVSHVRALTYFQGVPAVITCDQLRSGVVVPCRYEPGPHTAYLDFAQHYGTVLLPARPRSPRDKAKVEAAVQLGSPSPATRTDGRSAAGGTGRDGRAGSLMVRVLLIGCIVAPRPAGSEPPSSGHLLFWASGPRLPRWSRSRRFGMCAPPFLPLLRRCLWVGYAAALVRRRAHRPSRCLSWRSRRRSQAAMPRKLRA